MAQPFYRDNKMNSQKVLIEQKMQIIPGIPQGSLYPTLSSLSSGAVASDTDVQSLHNKVTKGLDKNLQDDEQLHALKV